MYKYREMYSDRHRRIMWWIYDSNGGPSDDQLGPFNFLSEAQEKIDELTKQDNKNDKVIPQVGQVWTWNAETLTGAITITAVTNSLIETSSLKMAIESLHESLTFNPANDLEWCAVNEDKWDDEHPVIFKDTTRLASGKINYNFNLDRHDDEYTRQQWQDKRSELFGVEFAAGVNSDDHAHNVDGGKLTSAIVDELVCDMDRDDGFCGHEIENLYPQSMYDNDRQPLAGMQAMVSVSGNKPLECVVNYIGDRYAIFSDSSPQEICATVNRCNFTPIDTRTDQEKLYDDFKNTIISILDGDLVNLDAGCHAAFNEFNITRKDNS